MVSDTVDRAMPRDELRRRVSGTAGFLLDLDGVIILRGDVIPGASAALHHLDELGLPYVALTNVSLESRATISERLAAAGIPLPADRIVSAVSGAADFTRRRFAGRPIYVLSSGDGMREFEGQLLVGHEEATEAAREGRGAVAAVVIGDAADEFTAEHLGTAFRLVRQGARLIAMHRNRWWFTPEGETLDAGPFVVALEYATQQKALVIGKPSAAIFRAALRRVRELAPGLDGLPADRFTMVGDDVWADVLAAQRIGLRGALVLTGRHGAPELARAAAARGGRMPTIVAESLAALVAALD